MTDYRFNLPIGDWSGDGHSYCKWFGFASRKPVEDVREAYFTACAVMGVSLDGSGAPCSEYEDHYLDPAWLTKAGLSVQEVWGTNSQEEKDGKWWCGPEDMAKIFLAFMTKYAPELELQMMEQPVMFPFYGMDDKGRHVSFMGYGCF